MEEYEDFVDHRILSGRVFMMNTIPHREWSHSIRNEANGSNALGKNRTHDEYSPGLDLGCYVTKFAPHEALNLIA